MARIVAVILATVIAMVLTALSTTSLVEGRFLPEQAVRLWPWNSLALGQLAGDTMLPDASPTVLRTAEADARRALMLDPGNVLAARSLGILAGMRKNERQALQALSYGEAMSRRDLVTELALIEWRVQHGDVAGALRHYDRALRTNPSLPTLLSTMISASADANIRRQVIALLSQRPAWRSAFLVQLIDEQTPADTVYGVLTGLKLDPAVPYERQVLSAGVGKLVGLGHVADARRLVPARAALIRNGNFEEENVFPPLDWSLADDANLNAVAEDGPAGRGKVLYLDARNGRGGELASQWLSLAPGRYRLSMTIGDVAGDVAARPRVTITCGGNAARSLLDWMLPTSPSVYRKMAGDFVVDAPCAAQRLAISLPGPLDEAAPRPWIDDIGVTPAR